jgi:hypothetical protein
MSDENDDLTLDENGASEELNDNATEASEASADTEPVRVNSVFTNRSASRTIKVGS